VNKKPVKKGSSAPATCHHRFVMDGDRWVEDPLRDDRTPNDYGTFNSIRLIPE